MNNIYLFACYQANEKRIKNKVLSNKEWCANSDSLFNSFTIHNIFPSKTHSQTQKAIGKKFN